MLPKRRRARAGAPGAERPAARFPGVAIHLAEPRMGRSRRAFLTRLALSKGFRVLDAYRCAGSERSRGRARAPPRRAGTSAAGCCAVASRTEVTAACPPPG